MRLFFLIAYAATIAPVTYAAEIALTYSGTGSGTLDGTSFASTSFTFTAKGDTDDWKIVIDDEIELIHATAEIEIAGLGSFSLLTSTLTTADISYHGRVMLGGGYRTISGSIANNGFWNWDGQTSIGPFTYESELVNWSYQGLPNISTSGGDLIFEDESTPLTFSAVVGDTIPEPASMLLLGAGLLSMSLFSARRVRGKTNESDEQSSRPIGGSTPD